MWATRYNNEGAVLGLLSAGANINMKDKVRGIS